MKSSPDKNKIRKDYQDMDEKEYWEARQNLYGLFSVLIEVDKRVNPQFYKKAGKEDLTAEKNGQVQELQNTNK